jgi:hypothetical protein
MRNNAWRSIFLIRERKVNFIKLAFVCFLVWLGTMVQASAVEIQGLPIRIDNTVEEVQKALNTTMEPEEFSTPVPMTPKKTQLHLKTKGIWVFFEKGKVSVIRADAPFSGNVGGIKLGDAAAKITKTLGKPIKEAKSGNTNTYTYYFDDVTTTKFIVNQDDEVETIFFMK